MAAQLNDVIYAERQGISGTLTVADVVALAGGGGSVINEIEVDFGAVATNNKIFTIADANVTINSKPIATVSGKPTTDHSTDEVMILELSVYANNMVAGVGFDLIVFSKNKLKGKFNINYTL